MARASKPAIAAAVDIGSYSVHLLVAEVDGHELRVVHDESAFLGLGRRLIDTGRLGAARSTLRETLEGYVAQASALGARTISLVGTDPLRRAADARGAIDDILASTGIEVAMRNAKSSGLTWRPTFPNVARPTSHRASGVVSATPC